MSFFFHHSSIRNKLSLVVISASFLVLLLVSLLFGAIEYVSFRRKAVSELETLSAILGSQLAQPLLDANALRAKQVLIGLENDPRLRAAYLFDKKYKPMAQFLDARSVAFAEASLKQDFSGKIPPEWQHAEITISSFSLNRLSLFVPISYQNSRLGSLYLVSDLSDLNQRLLELLLVVILAGGAAVGFAWSLAGWLHKPISGPILQLAETMHAISASGDYHLRGTRSSDDEVGQLVDGFNDMLTQIEIRDRKIEANQRSLEETVRERTAQLMQTVSDLELARNQAEEASQAKSAFLANMTHELRTPLVGVLGMNELLGETQLDAKQRSLTETVDRSGRDLLELINDILDFSRLGSGNLSLKMERTALLPLVEEALVLFADRACSKGLDLLCQIDPDAAWEVDADGLRLKQILTNLLSNAVKFTHQGHVALTLSLSDRGTFLFTVSDTGIGIDPLRQASIFEAFAQIDSSASRAFGGSGLGLSIVRELAALMSGSVRLDSSPGKGSSFQVELPLARRHPSFPRLPESRKGRSVLLCDATLLTRENRMRMLLDLGYSAVSVSTREETLQRLRNADLHANRFDMVLLTTDDHTEPDNAFIQKIQPYCRLVVCLRPHRWQGAAKPGVVEISLPLLWTRLLQEDLSQPPADAGSARAIQVEEIAPLRPAAAADLKRILIVDDNVSTRELIRLSLTRTQWGCDEAANADEALAAVGSMSYLLILMDINMPVTDGMAVTRKIRELGIETPIFALTAHGDEKIFEECRRAGMQGSLRKPFRQRELFALLEQQAVPPGSAGSAVMLEGRG